MRPRSGRLLGLYRVVFGLLPLWAFDSLRLPPDPWPREFHLRNSWLADWDWVHSLASQPVYVEQLQQLVTWTLFFFTIGFLTRPMYWLLAAELLVWTLVRLQRTGAHPWGVALVTVKYYFVTDARYAPVDWGLWIASHHSAAVLFSFLAVATELSMAAGPLLRSYRASRRRMRPLPVQRTHHRRFRLVRPAQIRSAAG